ncbi:unnamed protein product, partial [Allacma fusca]
MDSQCFGSCLFQARGFLSEDGEEILSDKLMTHISKVIDEGKSKSMIEKMTKCVENH